MVINVETVLSDRLNFSLTYIIRKGQIIEAPAELMNNPTTINQNWDGYSARVFLKRSSMLDFRQTPGVSQGGTGCFGFC